MTKKMTTSNANITGASGEKAAVSDFNSSLSFQPGGNISISAVVRHFSFMDTFPSAGISGLLLREQRYTDPL